jgi:8-oxo-dGTP pyrophosphatase MutT (NUDIX family)
MRWIDSLWTTTPPQCQKSDLRSSSTLDQVRAALRRLPIPERPCPERAASVAVILRTRNIAAELLLIRRSEFPGDPWAGHMALPGGHWENQDSNLEATALREVYEEVGIDLSRDGVLLGELPSLPARARRPNPDLYIVPFVFHLNGEPTLVRSPEVEEWIWAEVEALRGPPGDTLTVLLDGKSTEMPGWDIGGYPVWGLTYAILRSLFGAMEASGRIE